MVIIMKDKMENPPKGTWKYENYDNIIAGASTRSPIALFLAPFMAVWSGGSIGGIYITQIISDKFNLMLSLFGLPFLIGTVILLFITLMTIAGKVEVVIGMDSYVFTGLGIVGRKKRFDWNSIVRIYESEPSHRTTETDHEDRGTVNRRAIFMEGDTRIKFGSGLNEERRYYLVTELQYLHKNKKRS